MYMEIKLICTFSKGFALGLALKQRQKATQKWSICYDRIGPSQVAGPSVIFFLGGGAAAVYFGFWFSLGLVSVLGLGLVFFSSSVRLRLRVRFCLECRS